MVVDRRERVREVFLFFGEYHAWLDDRDGAVLVTNPTRVRLRQQQCPRALEDVWV